MLRPEFLCPSSPPDNHLTLSATAGGVDDEPPPYSAVVPRDHVGWPYYEFPCRSHLYDGATVPLRADSSRCEEDDEADSTSIPCRLFICGSGGATLGIGDDEVPDTKEDGATTSRRYGAILVGGAVIIFLMVLSLLVRFVMDKSLWRT